jgi:hypothetical protein
MAESLTFADNALTAGTDKTMTELFGGAQNFSGTVTYDVELRNAAQIKTLFALTHDDFPGAEGKLVTVNSVQRVAGNDKTISMQYIKLNY